jgi:hypothetical protein
VVPSEAVILSLSVAVVDNDVVHIRKFTVAPDRGTSIDVSDGVKSGDRIMLIRPPTSAMDNSSAPASYRIFDRFP